MSGPQPPRGTRDLLPPESERFTDLETKAAVLFPSFGYRRIITPTFEQTDLFVRGVGASTDIVSKEMYTFPGRSGGSLTLRPEGTAPVVRAVVGHQLWKRMPMPLKFWYSAAMFRYERPQKGRWREHHQLGIEAIGDEGPSIDGEVIEVASLLLKEAAVGEVTLLINSMGHPECRADYMPQLRAFLQTHRERLDADCNRRMEINPLRVFDCKVPEDQALLEEAPRLADFLCDACKKHFAEVERHLDEAGIAYSVAPRLVRGFDYYTRTTFEFQCTALDAAQNAVGGGGRYDGLVAELGGPPLPGIGFGLGIDRILLAQQLAKIDRPAKFCAVIPIEQDDAPRAAALVRLLRDHEIPAEKGQVAGRPLKDLLRKANQRGAGFVAILGPEERSVSDDTVTMRNMLDGAQQRMTIPMVPGWIRERLR